MAMASSASASLSSHIELPLITVQPTFPEVVHDIGSGSDASAEDCWISCYWKGKTSVHGKVRVLEAEGGGAVELVARDGVTCRMVDGKTTTLECSCEQLAIPPTLVHFPLRTDRLANFGPVNSLDIAPDGSRYVVGGDNGLVRVVELSPSHSSTQAPRQIALKGHLADLTVVRFFPSGEVVLTGAMDMTIRIYSALSGKEVRTLTGHTKSVSGFFILGKGRKILSSSLDGTIRLWNIAEAKVERTWRFDQPVSAFSVSQFTGSTALAEDYPEIEELYAIAAHTNGSATALPLGTDTSAPLLRLRAGSSPLHSIALDSDSGRLALGSRNGRVALFQLPALDATSPRPAQETLAPLLTLSRSDTVVHRLCFCTTSNLAPTQDLLVAGADGLPFRVTLRQDPSDATSTTASIVDEYSGLDCEASTSAIASHGWIWVAGADGMIRRYKG
ncbi:BZ3500_MvSof-1268-A1-R1_Chr8-1g09995 [Microbotryum saponariae]|uniref:BZ3500_MvSof-1268-A1-R1_Chr8-1g09995 protein n=1 Tax=Microbotryum saponariae TaxID=289078 RepID=A0A2X0KUQ4_9BASI|nr:BZ3500_MvSof-1268-A1-R1_Chr8-1g09995 [Microbotryum saponariae]SDA08281.1 BZ3501_MvSof-1269-A2-R1_Chr8-1g09718 [Microbotryum saponariae]